MTESSAQSRSIHFRFDDGAVDPDRVAQELLAAIDGVDEVVVEMVGEFRPDAIERMLVVLRVRPPAERPRLVLRVARRGAISIDPRPDRIVLCGGEQLEQDLIWARGIVSDAGELVVELVVSGSNWFDLHHVAQKVDSFGASLQLRVVDDRERAPLLDVPALELRAVTGWFASIWASFDGDSLPTSLEAGGFDRMRRDFRRQFLRAVRDRSLEPGALALRFPTPEHPSFEDETFANQLVSWFAGVDCPQSLVEWARQLVERDDAVRVARTRAWVRILIQKVVLETEEPEFTALLREIYGDEELRPVLFDEDAECAPSWVTETWSRDLGLRALGPRTAPFGLAPTPGEAPASPRVTVLIPSYRHEAFIVQCIESALAQTDPDTVVMVVDDRSPDATVERARSIEDPRLTVHVNESNLGLGSSVLAALDRIGTPYVALLNSDDLFHPERVARCVAALDGDDSVQVVTTELFLIDPDGGEITIDNASRIRDGRNVADWVRWYEGVREGGDELFGRLLEHNFLATSSNLVCRADFLREEAEALRSLKYCLDWHLFMVAALRDGLRHLPERLAAYRLHPNNTVWFRDGKRWSYYLEVARVVAHALRRFFERRSNEHGEDRARRECVRLVAEFVERNTEVDGAAVHLNELLSGLELDELAASDEHARDAVQAMSNRSSRETRFGYASVDLDDDELEQGLAAMRSDRGEARRLRVLAEVGLEDRDAWRNDAEWARSRLKEVEGSQRQIDRLESEVRKMASRVLGPVKGNLDDFGFAVFSDDSAVGRIRQGLTWLETALTTLAAKGLERIEERYRIENERNQARQELRVTGERLEAAEQLKSALRERVELAQGRAEVAQERAQQVETKRQVLADELAAARQEIRDIEGSLTAEQASLAAAREAIDGHKSQIRQLRTAREKLDERRRSLRTQVESLRDDLAGTQAELRNLRATKEWRIGNFIWNKIPFFGKSRRLARRSFKRVRESLVRTMMFLRRLFRSREPDALQIAAGSTSTFPIISHTFVYQELTCMHTMLGADVKLFHTQKGDPADLHDAFKYLDDNRQFVHPAWDVHTADFEHYKQTQPERVTSLLEALSKESGLSIEDIENRFELRMAFTYARRLELWGADYVHTYFFYDQALCGLVASWVLGIPRGVSTYADHMMQDWPLKCTALHLRKADVIVATSKRIREELVGIGGEEIRDKVIVKPNGVDGRRFPAVTRQVKSGGPFEMVCVSRVEPKKGMIEMAEAAKLLKDRGIDVRMHVIGGVDKGIESSEKYGRQLEARIQELGVQDTVIMHGRMMQNEIREHLTKADAFIAPFVETESGDKDGIPTAILEAISTGLPVVATDAGSIPEIIDDGVEGRVVPQKSPEALADAVAAMAADHDGRRAMGVKARERFEKEFDTNATEPRLHERIRAAVAARKSTAGV